jgi:RNA recognition motif-containing protein
LRYVTFSTVEEATQAITQQHGGILEGREVVVQFSNTDADIRDTVKISY